MIGFTNQELAAFESALKYYTTAKDSGHESLFEAMRYSLMAGGKRIRPYIVWAFCKCLGGKFEDCLPFASLQDI